MECYLDNSATTRCFDSVADLMTRVMCLDYGNPSSMHRKGVQAEQYLRYAKDVFSGILKVDGKELFFTSGGTESDNTALIGCAFANCRAGRHLITTAIEHPAILQTMQYLEEQGFEEPAGRAKVTEGYNLPCSYVIHTVGPIVRGKVTEQDRTLLASCYRSCLAAAVEWKMKSVAFCCISTGEFHFPNKPAAEIAIKTVEEWEKGNLLA